MSTQTIAIENAKTGEVTEAVYEHPLVVRLCHWVNAVALFVMVGSGLQIFRAFPSFGAKIPQKDLLNWPKVSARNAARRRTESGPPMEATREGRSIRRSIRSTVTTSGR